MLTGIGGDLGASGRAFGSGTVPAQLQQDYVPARQCDGQHPRGVCVCVSACPVPLPAPTCSYISGTSQVHGVLMRAVFLQVARLAMGVWFFAHSDPVKVLCTCSHHAKETHQQAGDAHFVTGWRPPAGCCYLTGEASTESWKDARVQGGFS